MEAKLEHMNERTIKSRDGDRESFNPARSYSKFERRSRFAARVLPFPEREMQFC